MPTTKVYLPEKVEVMPSKRAYLFRAGFKGHPIIIDEPMRQIVNQIYTEGLERIHAQIYYQTLSVDHLPSTLIPKSFLGVAQISLFASTLGDELDTAINQYIATENVLSATLLDAWGSEALESLNQEFDRRLRTQYGGGTRRFSPGYQDISLQANRQILDLLGVTEITAHHETGILFPKKSTVCMIGF